MKLTCLVIDDEPVARKVLREYIADYPFLHLIGQAENAFQATALLQEQQVDLMFMDIEMPRMNGLSFLRSLHSPPMTIITTAFQEHALEGYELNVLDYLLKPISAERFLKAASKAREYYELQKGEGKKAKNYFFVKCNNIYEKINFEDILYLEALENFVAIHTTNKRLVAWITLRNAEELLPSDLFVKCHRSFIVSLSRIDRLDKNSIILGKHTVPISDKHRADLMSSIILLKRKSGD